MGNTEAHGLAYMVFHLSESESVSAAVLKRATLRDMHRPQWLLDDWQNECRELCRSVPIADWVHDDARGFARWSALARFS